jgi:hypothetical protein
MIVVRAYGKRFTIVAGFRDIRDYRFGMGMRKTHTSVGYQPWRPASFSCRKYDPLREIDWVTSRFPKMLLPDPGLEGLKVELNGTRLATSFADGLHTFTCPPNLKGENIVKVTVDGIPLPDFRIPGNGIAGIISFLPQ